jgi:hypothetical protein
MRAGEAMLPDWITPSALTGLAAAPAKALASRFQKRHQLRKAIEAAARAAGDTAPEHRDRFCSKFFLRREPRSIARRHAKTVDAGRRRS